MLGSTNAIILHKTNYSESSLIVKAFTREFGLRSLLIKGAKKKNSRIPAALFEPLSLVETVLPIKEKAGLIIPREIRSAGALHHMQLDTTKRMMALFLSEIMYKSLREGQTDKGQYDFLESALLFLDATTENISNFHLWFLAEYSRFSGFYPRLSQGDYFDLSEGLFLDKIPLHGHYAKGSEVAVLKQLLGTKIDNLTALKMSREMRQRTLEILIAYFQTHNENMREIKSHKVLEMVLD